MVIRPAYNLVRPHLPRKWGVMAGVAVRDFALFDRADHQPEYQVGLVDAIRSTVKDGDCVLDIAAGRGVAAVWAHRAGAEQVVSYEASRQMVQLARQTVAANVATSVQVRHGVVGSPPDGAVWGEYVDVTRVPPSELPECDVLVLDAEGSEPDILEQLHHRPRAIIVETHPEMGVGLDSIREPLVRSGYGVDIRDYQPDRPEKDVVVAVEPEAIDRTPSSRQDPDSLRGDDRHGSWREVCRSLEAEEGMDHA